MYDFPSTVRGQYAAAFGATANWREVVVAPVAGLIYLSGPDFAEFARGQAGHWNRFSAGRLTRRGKLRFAPRKFSGRGSGGEKIKNTVGSFIAVANDDDNPVTVLASPGSRDAGNQVYESTGD